MTNETILLIVLFVVAVFIFYKLFRMLVRAIIVAVAGFSFPYVVNYLNLGLPIVANTSTALQFASWAIGLLLIYELFHFITYFLKIILWPFKLLFKRFKKHA